MRKHLFLLISLFFLLSSLSSAFSLDDPKEHPPLPAKLPAPATVIRIRGKVSTPAKRYHSVLPVVTPRLNALPDEPRSWSAIGPLSRPKPLPIRKPLGPDPIRFTMQANKTSIAIGEEFDITITAELLPILPSQLFFLESQRAFSLKILMPEGFEQTGGDYYHLVSGALSAEGVSRVAYSLRGKLLQPSKGCFRLLRGERNATDQNLFVDKGILCIPINNDSLTVHSISDSLGSVPQARALATSTSCNAPTIGWKGNFAQKRNDACMENVSNPAVATLAVNGCSGTINWYRRVNGDSPTLISSGSSVFYETQSPHQANIVTYSYFARCACSGGDESPLSNEYTVQLNRCSSCPANWVNDGGAYCNGDHRYQNQRDNNGCSTTFNQVRVVDLGFSCDCVTTPNWGWTDNYRCSPNVPMMRQRLEHDYNGCTNRGDRWVDVQACSGECGGQSPNWGWTDNYRCSPNVPMMRQRLEHDYNGCTNRGDRWVDVQACSGECGGQSPNWGWTDNYRCSPNVPMMRQRLEHDYNGCTNRGDRWVDVQACSGECGGQSPNWGWTDNYRCSPNVPMMRQRLEHDYNGCTNQGDRWVDFQACSGECGGQSPNWQGTDNYRCDPNGSKMRQRLEHDYNGCTNQGDRWVDFQACSGECGGQSPSWQNKEVRCNGGNRHWWQHDDNGCTNQGDRWGDVVEYNTCVCLPKTPITPYIRVAPNAFTTNTSYVVCEGTYIAFGMDHAVGTGYTMQWSGPNNSQGPLNNNWEILTIQPSEGGTYTYTVTDPTGCVNSAQVNITVTPASYYGTVDEASCNLVAGWLVDRTCTERSNKVRIVVDGVLVATVLADGVRADVRQVILNLPPGFNQYGYRWSVLANLRQGVHTVVVTDMQGNPLNNSQNLSLGSSFSVAPPVKVNSQPFTYTNNYTLCEGDGLAFGMDRDPATGYSLQWSGPNGSQGPAIHSLSDNWILPTITTAQEGMYTYTVTDPAGCVNSAQVAISVTPGNYGISPDEVTCSRVRGWIVNYNCPEQSVPIRILIDGQLVEAIVANMPRADVRLYILGRTTGTDLYGFDWVIPAQLRQGVHTVTITDSKGSILAGPYTVGRAPGATLVSTNQDPFTVGSSFTVCEGNRVAFGRDFFPADNPGTSLQWSGPNGAQGPLNGDWTIGAIQPSQAGSYTYTTTDALGCSSTAQVDITVTPASYGITLDQRDCSRIAGWIVNYNCPEQSVPIRILIDGQLVESITPNVTRADVRQGVLGRSSGNDQLGFIWVVPANLRQGTHTVTITDSKGTVLVEPFTIGGVVVTPLVLVAPNGFNSAPSYTVCEGNGVAFGRDRWPANFPGYTMQWSGPNNTQSTVNEDWTLGAIQPSQGGTYTYTVTDPTGCVNSAQVNINVTPANYAIALDQRDCSRIAGWIVNYNCPEQSVPIRILIDGQLVESITPNVTRADVRQGVLGRNSGNDQLGFIWVVPANLRQGTHTVTITDSKGTVLVEPFTMGRAPGSTYVLANGNPFTVGSSFTVCEGSGVAFGRDFFPADNPGTSLQWSGPNGAQGPLNGDWDISTIQPSQAGSYTYTTTDALGCSSTAQVNITVNSKPIFGFAAAGASPTSYSANTTGPVTNQVTICSGGMLTFSNLTLSQPNIGLIEKSFSSGNVTLGGVAIPVDRPQNIIGPGQMTQGFNQTYGLYATTDSNIGTIEQQYTPYVDANGNGQYDVGECLGDRITLLYTILPGVAPVITATSATICSGQSTVLTATGCAGTVTWQGGSTGSTFTTPALTQTTVYTASCSSGSCAALPASFTVVVNAQSTASISGNLTICAGQTTTLTASGGSTYRWSTGATTPSISVSATGSYSITVSSGSSCSATASAVVAVTTLPDSPTITARVAGTSSAQSITLTAAGCSAGNTPRWSGPGSTTALGATWILPFTQTSTYAMRCEASTGCFSQSATLTATYTTPSTPIIRASAITICAGDSVSLSASGCPTGATVLWSSGQTGTTIGLAPTASANYTAVCRLGEVSGEASNQLRITVSNSLTVTGRTSYNVGETISLTAVSSAPGSVTYTWSGPSGYTQSGAVLQWLGAAVTQSGSYTIVAKATTGCVGRQVVSIQVSGSTNVILTQGLNPSAVCAGASLSVPFSTTGTYNAGNLYTVQLSDVSGSFVNSTTLGSGTTSPIAAVVPATLLSGSYQVRVVSSYPITEGSATPLTISGTASLSAGSNSPAGEVSVGGSLSLASSGQNLTGATYRWSGPNSYTSTAPNPVIASSTTANNGLYTVVATTPGGCTATAQTSVSLGAACQMSFDGNPVASCDSSAADITRRGMITVKLLNVPLGSNLRISLYQQTTLVTTLTSNPASFTGLRDGSYRLDAYTLVGTDTCRAGVRTLTVRCSSEQPNIRIKSVDSTGQETDLIPRVGGGLGKLRLSVEELDGLDLSGYTYLWAEPASTSATSTTLTGRRIGEYKVTLVNGADTLVAYTTLRSKPCKQVAHTYQCGHPATPVGTLDGTGISNLAPGDTIRTGDFDVIVVEVTGGDSSGWTGKGYTLIPYLGDTQIAVDFTNATVNDCYEYTGGGTVQSAYDANYFRNTILSQSVNVDIGAQYQTTMLEIADLLKTYNPATDITRLQELTIRLASQKDSVVKDTLLTVEQRNVIINNVALISGEISSFTSCGAGGRLGASPNGRVAADNTCNLESLQTLVSAGIPVITEKTVASTTFQTGDLQAGIAREFFTDNNCPTLNDVPPGNLQSGQRLVYNVYRNYAEEDLRHIYEYGHSNGDFDAGDIIDGVRNALSSKAENRIINAFYSGNGKKFIFGENDPVTQELEYHPTSATYFRAFENRLRQAASDGTIAKLTNTFIFVNTEENPGGIGRLNFSGVGEVVRSILKYDFYGIFGGIQQIKIDVNLVDVTSEIPEYLPATSGTVGIGVNKNTRTVTTRKLYATYHLIDLYGADWEDVYNGSNLKSMSDALKAFFVLQHCHSGYRPFEVEMIYKKPPVVIWSK